jgi:hypothetical protein
MAASLSPAANHPCIRCQRQFGPDEVMFMAATEPPRYWNRIRTAPTCFECLDATEREIASGQCGVGCRGCYRIMTPLVEPFRRDDVFAGTRLACRAPSQATAAGPVLRSVPHQVPEAEGLQPGLALPI